MNEFDKIMGSSINVLSNVPLNWGSSIDIDDTELNGFFKSIAKAVKKTVSGATKSVAHWVDNRKAFVKKVGKEIKKVSKTPVGNAIFTVAASAAAALVAGPVAGAAIGSKGFKDNNLVKSVNNVIKSVKTNDVTKSATSFVKEVNNEVKNITENSDFLDAYNTLKSQGMNDSEIKKIWATSGAYADSAIPTISESIQPLIYSEKLASGYSEKDAQIIARNQSDIVAANSVDKVRKQYSAGSVGPIALGALAVLLLMK